jgi:biopolymer transport protein ExbD
MGKTAIRCGASRTLLTWRPSDQFLRVKRDVEYCSINLAPVTGILLSLWLLFAGVLPALDGSIWQSVEFVTARHSTPVPSALRDDAIIVGVSASGDVYYGQTHISAGDLESRIRKSLQIGAEKRIYLNIDSRVHYEDLKTVFPQIAAAGIQNITFVTK